jgi:hypothetical protein
MEIVIYLVIVVVIAVLAVRIGMIVAPLVGRMAPADDADDGGGSADAEEPDLDDKEPW